MESSGYEKCTSQRRAFKVVGSRRFGTLRCPLRRAGGEQHHAGVLHLQLRISLRVIKKEARPEGVSAVGEPEEIRCPGARHRVRSCQRQAADKQQSTGLLHLHLRISLQVIKKEARPEGVSAVGGPEEIRCPGARHRVRSCQRRAADKQQSTGLLHLHLRISLRVIKKEAHPKRCASFLVDPRRFELPTPTMRM